MVRRYLNIEGNLDLCGNLPQLSGATYVQAAATGLGKNCSTSNAVSSLAADSPAATKQAPAAAPSMTGGQIAMVAGITAGVCAGMAGVAAATAMGVQKKRRKQEHRNAAAAAAADNRIFSRTANTRRDRNIELFGGVCEPGPVGESVVAAARGGSAMLAAGSREVELAAVPPASYVHTDQPDDIYTRFEGAGGDSQHDNAGCP